MEREHGRIVSVSTATLGSVLDGDHAAGATELVVFDAGDFDEDGGTLSINGANLAYASVDDDAATITLTDPLPAAALDGDFVACWSTLYNTAVTVKTAMVQVDGDDDNPDPIEATVPHFLADKLADGDRGGPGESVVLGYDEEDDEWQILDVRGLAGASGAGVKFCNTDTYTVTAAGDQTFTLTYAPIDGSLRVSWNGQDQPPSNWTLDGVTLTLADPNGFVQANDEFATQYAYRTGLAPATGQWKYLQTTSSDTINRSGLTWDDSTWPSGDDPFGSGIGYLNYKPDFATRWDLNTALWIRTHLPSAASYSVSVTVDNSCDIYWNGAKIASVTLNGSLPQPAQGPFAIPAADIQADNVLAIRALDTGGLAYLDVEIGS